jgi:hypothetical protein
VLVSYTGPDTGLVFAENSSENSKLTQTVMLIFSIQGHLADVAIKVILLADSIRSRLLAWFGSPIIKKIPEYHPPNVYGYVEI